MTDTKYEKVWVQNIKGMLRGVPFTDEIKAACLREFETFLSESETRERDARAKAIEEAAKVADEAAAMRERLYQENGASLNASKSAQALVIAANIRALQSEER